MRSPFGAPAVSTFPRGSTILCLRRPPKLTPGDGVVVGLGSIPPGNQGSPQLIASPSFAPLAHVHAWSVQLKAGRGALVGCIFYTPLLRRPLLPCWTSQRRISAAARSPSLRFWAPSLKERTSGCGVMPQWPVCCCHAEGNRRHGVL